MEANVLVINDKDEEQDIDRPGWVEVDPILAKLSSVAESGGDTIKIIRKCETLEAALDFLTWYHLCDVVLLDLVGVVAEKENQIDLSGIQSAIGKIHDKAPRIPVICFSRLSFSAATLLDAFNANVEGFIGKNIPYSEPVSVVTQEDTADELKLACAAILGAADRYYEFKTEFYREVEEGTIRKEGAIHDQKGRIKDQLDFLNRIALIDPLKEVFPKVRREGGPPTKDQLDYEMPYYRLPSLSTAIMQATDKGVACRKSEILLQRVGDFVQMYCFLLISGPQPRGTFAADCCMTSTDDARNLRNVVRRILGVR